MRKHTCFSSGCMTAYKDILITIMTSINTVMAYNNYTLQLFHQPISLTKDEAELMMLRWMLNHDLSLGTSRVVAIENHNCTCSLLVDEI